MSFIKLKNSYSHHLWLLRAWGYNLSSILMEQKVCKTISYCSIWIFQNVWFLFILAMVYNSLANKALPVSPVGRTKSVVHVYLSQLWQLITEVSDVILACLYLNGTVLEDVSLVFSWCFYYVGKCSKKCWPQVNLTMNVLVGKAMTQ